MLLLSIYFFIKLYFCEVHRSFNIIKTGQTVQLKKYINALLVALYDEPIKKPQQSNNRAYKICLYLNYPESLYHIIEENANEILSLLGP